MTRKQLRAEVERLREERDYWKAIVEHYRKLEVDRYLGKTEASQ